MNKNIILIKLIFNQKISAIKKIYIYNYYVIILNLMKNKLLKHIDLYDNVEKIPFKQIDEFLQKSLKNEN